MSGIPADIIGSAAQAGFTAAEASRIRDGDRAAQAAAAARQAKAADLAADSVETSDADTEVHTDAEGAGSQGRTIEEETSPDSDDNGDAGTDDGEGNGPRLDIQV